MQQFCRKKGVEDVLSRGQKELPQLKRYIFIKKGEKKVHFCNFSFFLRRKFSAKLRNFAEKKTPKIENFRQNCKIPAILSKILSVKIFFFLRIGDVCLQVRQF